MGNRRPFKVRWFSAAIGERVGKSYATRERQMACAREASQFADVTVWEDDQYGYAKTGTVRTYTSPIE